MYTLVLSSVTEECGVLCVIPSSSFSLVDSHGENGGVVIYYPVKILCLKHEDRVQCLSPVISVMGWNMQGLNARDVSMQPPDQ